jgi:hypothetical protein
MSNQTEKVFFFSAKVSSIADGLKRKKERKKVFFPPFEKFSPLIFFFFLSIRCHQFSEFEWKKLVIVPFT